MMISSCISVKKEGDSIELLILLESTKKRLNDSWRFINETKEINSYYYGVMQCDSCAINCPCSYSYAQQLGSNYVLWV